MSEPLLIPKLGNTVEDVTIIEWMVEDGAQVSKGQEVLEIETDKSTFAVEATADGYIHFAPFDTGDVVPVFTVVAVIGEKEDVFPSQEPEPQAEEAAPAVEEETPASEPEGVAPAATPAATASDEGRLAVSPRARHLAEKKGVDLSQVTPSGPGGRIIERDVIAYLEQRPAVTPVARKMAEDAGLDVERLTGTGIGGRITKKDVEAALAARAAEPAHDVPAAMPAAPAPLPEGDVLERKPLTGIRKIIAQRMGESVHTTARVTLVMEADVTEFVAMRQRLKAQVAEEWGFAPGYNDLLGFIVARLLRQYPFMNARLTPDAIEYMAHVNLGMAVDTDRGLVVPNIKDADKKSLREFGAEFRELVKQARSGRISPDHLTGGTFTITSLGAFDVDAFTPVINMPEAAILGVGRIAPKPVVKDGEIVIREMMTLSLVFDHRLVDGAPAARFQREIKRYLEDPYLILALA
jgi:pyruvate dehydrogenase E2 component (dihydrolipoamide acetyltransferase)